MSEDFSCSDFTEATSAPGAESRGNYVDSSTDKFFYKYIKYDNEDSNIFKFITFINRVFLMLCIFKAKWIHNMNLN